MKIDYQSLTSLLNIRLSNLIFQLIFLMKAFSFITACATALCVCFVACIPEGIPQSQENYSDLVNGWENYFNQHPEHTDSVSHEYKNYIRWRTFWDSRSQCIDSMYSGKPKLITAIVNQYMENMDYHQRSTIVASNWRPVGPKNLEYQTNGLVSAVYVDTVSDKNNNTIYIGSNSGGIWKTNDGGINWQNVTDRSFLPCIGIWDIQGDPTDGNVLYAGTGGNFMGRGYGYGIGIIRTQDAGYSWQVIYPIPTTELTQVYRILIDPTNPERIYAAVGTKLIRLIKNGTTWDTTTLFTTPNLGLKIDEHRMIRDIEMVPGRPDTLYLATDHRHWHGRNAQVWMITGVTSTPSATQLDCNFPDTNLWSAQRYEIAVTSQNPASVYVAGDYLKDTIIDTTECKISHVAISKSKDYGTTWEKKYDQAQGPSYFPQYYLASGRVDYYKMELLIDPTDTNIIYVGGNTVSRVRNWQTEETTHYDMGATNGYHCDTRALVILNNRNIFAGNDGGISKSTDFIDHWTNINGNGLILTQYWDMGSTNLKPSWIGGGTMDNSFSLYQNGQWSKTGGGDQANMDINYESDNAFFIYSAAFGGGGNPIIKVSHNGGASWNPNWIILPDGSYNPAIKINPLRPRSVFFGGHNLYKSITPDNTSFLTIPVNIEGNTGIIKPKEKICDIEIAGNDSNTMYVAFYWGVYDSCCEHDSVYKLIKTKNGGTTFTAIVDTTLSNAFDSAVYFLGITDILLCPTDTSKLWVTLGGFDAPTSGAEVKKRVFYSADGGLTFADISRGLPNFPVNCITYWNNGANGLFVGTDVGVFYK
ncbi:MAG: hypothetical protein ABIJ04_12765, partial [Bacteroidota bacterium]